MKKPDLLILIAIWEFFTAFAALIVIAAIAIFGFSGFLGNWDGWSYNSGRMWDFGNMPNVVAVFFLSVIIFIFACYLILAILSGIGVLTGKEWGRITAMVHSAVGLFWFPVGTVLGALSIIYLTKQEVKDYFIPPLPKV